ncbi:DUF6053 domain-containing protein [Lysobacter enzymogenes]|uniref:DUF6053 domain-containing protein n=1 Tax=Lysobacter enzymogenes TaxID=69 RepID=UPI003D18D956
MGGASAPTLSSRIAATGQKSVGAEAPPTRAPSRSRLGWPGRRSLTAQPRQPPSPAAARLARMARFAAR